MYEMQQKAMEFHEGFGHPVADGPTLIPMELAEKRAKWMREEVQEFLDAVEAGDIVGMYDALIDIAYFLMGTAVVTGFDLEPGFNVVHEANMAKLGPDGKPIYGDDGKVQKPEGWVAPEERLIPLIEQQIEDGEVYALAMSLADDIRGDRPTRIPPGTNARIVGRAWNGAGVILRKAAADLAAYGRWEGMKR